MSPPIVGRVARKEMLQFVRDGRARWAGIIVAVLLGVALLSGWHHVSAAAAEQAVAQAATRTSWLKQPPKNPHSAAHYGIYAFKPQSWLGAVDSGVQPYVGVAALLEAHVQNEYRYRPAADRSAAQRFGDFTAAMVMQVLVPLMIVLLAFGTIVSEREDGTWRQLQATGVRLRSVLIGKALGVSAGVAAICIPASLVAALILTLWAPPGVTGADPGRFIALTLIYVLWCAVWLGATLLVSSVARSSRTALVTLLAVWMVSTLAAPRLAADVAAWRHRTPTQAEFQEALNLDLSDATTRNARLQAKRQAVLAQYGVSTVEELPINFSGVSLQEGEEHANEVFDKHFGGLYDTFDRQNALVRRAGWLAPALALRSSSMGLSGTDWFQHRHFATAAETYRRDLQRLLNHDVAINQKPGQTYLADTSFWANVPDFTYVAPPTADVLGRQAGSIAVLAVWAFILFAVAAVVIDRRSATAGVA